MLPAAAELDALLSETQLDTHERPHTRRHLRNAADPKQTCPVCSVGVHGRLLRQHLRLCAPDLVAFILTQGDWPAQPSDAVTLAARGEVAALAALKEARFHQGLSWAQAATALGCSERRLRALLRKDSLTIPLVRDQEPLDVVYEDADLLVVAKPPDLRVHPVHRFEGGSLLNRAVTHLGGDVPSVVHRLDQDTSGVTLLVKNPAWAAPVSQQFAAKAVGKEYLALCLGTPPARAFTVDAPIGRHPRHAPARVLDGADPEAKAARTDCAVLAYRPAAGGRPAACCVLAMPRTGRTHQIRLHLAAAGLPIILDTFYGPPDALVAAGLGCGEEALDAVIARQALHAAALSLTHPETGQPLRFQAPLLADMAAAAAGLGLGEQGCAGDVEALAALPDFAELEWAAGTCMDVVHKK